MSSKTRVTMMDIATKAGVSQPTVSFVLNGQLSNRISQQTRDKVLAAAQELGYIKRNKNNQEESKIKSNSNVSVSELDDYAYKIALILDGALVTNDHFICALQSATERAHHKGITLSIISASLYSNSQEQDQKVHLQHVLTEINGSYYDGVIIASSATRDLIENIKIDKPLVYLNCLPLGDNTSPAIVPDDFGGAYNLAESLISCYRKPHIIAGDEWMKATMERTRAIVSCYNKYGIRLNQQNITYTNWSFKECFSAVLNLLTTTNHDANADGLEEYNNPQALYRNLQVRPKQERPDIIFCASDFLANAAYQAVYYAGLKIPEDIAIAGYDNQLLSMELYPELSTVVLPYADMGELAIEKICEVIDLNRNSESLQNSAKDDEGHIIKVPSSVILRAST